MQIDLSILVSILVGLCTIVTFIRTNAKNQEHTNSKIEVVQNDIKHLSERVEKHNGVIERTYKLEEAQAVLEQQMKVEQHRMDDAEMAIEKNREKMINLTRRN